MTENLSFNTSIQTSKEVNSTQISKKEHFRKDNDQIHFMNSCRFQGSIFTNAIDSFVEISFVLLCSFSKSTQLKSYFFELLRECFEQYDALMSSENPDDEEESNVKEEFLALIRQPVWDYLALNCPSFANRDSEAVFSEIFSCSIFDKLRMEEKHIFQTCYMLKGHCDKDGEDVRNPAILKSGLRIRYRISTKSATA